jgi:hypothetical protein
MTHFCVSTAGKKNDPKRLSIMGISVEVPFQRDAETLSQPRSRGLNRIGPSFRAGRPQPTDSFANPLAATRGKAPNPQTQSPIPGRAAPC